MSWASHRYSRQQHSRRQYEANEEEDKQVEKGEASREAIDLSFGAWFKDVIRMWLHEHFLWWRKPKV